MVESPTMMDAAVYYSADRIAIERLEVPTPDAGEALVKVAMCGICGSDLMTWYTDAKAPTVLGHEIVGHIAALGDQARAADRTLRVGDRVFVHHHAPCGLCHTCRRGFETLCTEFASNTLLNGGFAEYVHVPAELVRTEMIVLPDAISDEEGTCLEPLACCVRGVQRARITTGMSVVIIGLGPLGQLYLRTAIAAGARVVGVNRGRERRELAASSGARVSPAVAGDIRAQLDQDTPDVIVMCTTGPEALELAREVAGRGTVVQLFAPGGPGTSLPWSADELFFNEISVQASYSADSNDIRSALDLVAHGHVLLDGIVSDHFPLRDLREGMNLARSRGNVQKVVIDVGA